MAPSTRTSKTAGESTDEAAGTTGSETSPAVTDQPADTAKATTKERPESLRFAGSSVVERRFSVKDLKTFDEDYDGEPLVFSSKDNDHRVSTDGLSDKVVAGLLKQPNIKASTVDLTVDA